MQQQAKCCVHVLGPFRLPWSLWTWGRRARKCTTELTPTVLCSGPPSPASPLVCVTRLGTTLSRRWKGHWSDTLRPKEFLQRHFRKDYQRHQRGLWHWDSGGKSREQMVQPTWNPSLYWNDSPRHCPGFPCKSGVWTSLESVVRTWLHWIQETCGHCIRLTTFSWNNSFKEEISRFSEVGNYPLSLTALVVVQSLSLVQLLQSHGLWPTVFSVHWICQARILEWVAISASREINPEYSLEGLMLKLQYFGHMMQRIDLTEKTWYWETLKAGGEGDSRGWELRQHDRLNGHEFEQTPRDGEGQGSLECCSPWGHKESDMTSQLNSNHYHQGRQK